MGKDACRAVRGLKNARESELSLQTSLAQLTSIRRGDSMSFALRHTRENPCARFLNVAARRGPWI